MTFATQLALPVSTSRLAITSASTKIEDFHVSAPCAGAADTCRDHASVGAREQNVSMTSIAHTMKSTRCIAWRRAEKHFNLRPAVARVTCASDRVSYALCLLLR